MGAVFTSWPWMGPSQILLLQFRVDLGVMAMKRYSAFIRSPELDLHHQMQFSIILGEPIFKGWGYSQRIPSPADRVTEACLIK